MFQDKPTSAVVTFSSPGEGRQSNLSTFFAEPLIRLDHCKHELASHKLLRLLGLSETAGPYVLMADIVPVGSFGFDMLAEPWEHVHVPGHAHQLGALSLATRAFQVAVTYYPKSNDPSDIREAGRMGRRIAMAELRRDMQEYQRQQLRQARGRKI